MKLGAAAIALALTLTTGCDRIEPAVRRAARTVTAIPTPQHVAPGLVALDCEGSGPLRPARRGYCVRLKHYVTKPARASLEAAAQAMAEHFHGARILFMEASWPQGTRPMPPHHSHGDGREIDLALYWTDLDGKPLAVLPNTSGYHAYEPPLREADRACVGQRSILNDAPDPPRNRRWKLDEVRTRAMIQQFASDPRVRRVFIEPHLKVRLDFANNPKVRFAGCNAARHDDHLHVDFY